MASPRPSAAPAIRVEDAASIGRSYASVATWSKEGARSVPGLGASRRALRTRSFTPYASGGAPVLDSASMALVNLRTATRADVLAYFRNSWALSEALFSGLRTDASFYMIPDKLRRPLIFYFGHPAALYINKMHQAGLVDHVHPYYQKLFETGVDEMSWDDMDVMQDVDFAWPDVSDVMAFRDAVKDAVEKAILTSMPEPAVTPVTPESLWWSLFMAFEHDHIHLETSSVLIRQLPVDAVEEPVGWRTAPSAAPAPSDAPVNALVVVPPVRTAIGKPRDFPSFGWDNEYGCRSVDVPAFAASGFLVSNAEFLPFVEAGGYRERSWWVSREGDDEGWRWLQYRAATHPSFWVAGAHADMAVYHGGKPDAPYQKDEGHAAAGSGSVRAWGLRTVFSVIPMPWDWPVEVNTLEAHAFLAWKAAQEGGGVRYRVPTEAEYHALRADPCPFPDTTVTPEGCTAVPAGSTSVPLLEFAKSPVAPDAVGSAADSSNSHDSGDCATGDDTSSGGSSSMVHTHSSSSSAVGAQRGASRRLRLEPRGLDDACSASAGAGDDAAVFDIVMQGAPRGNVNWRWHSPSPVNAYAPSPRGFHDAHGNVWEWVEDHFAPLPGFEIHYLYDDFSSPCFDGWHTMIVGGSWASKGNLASSFARYHFRRHFFQHLGFRYVRVGPDAPEAYPGAASVANLWEGAASLVARDITDGYAALPAKLAFPPAALGLECAMDYPANVARLTEQAFAVHALPLGIAPSGARALHLGCGVGAGTFELARAFGAVVGVDFNDASVRHARILQHHGQFEYERTREGVLTDTAVVRVDSAVDRARVTFVHADACELSSATLGCSSSFDIVLADGLLTRLQQPLALVNRFADLVRPGGVLIVSSSNNWLPSVTPRNSWLGGFRLNGEDQCTRTMLTYCLKRAFELVETVDLARASRLHKRRITLDVMEATIWRRRA